MPIEVRGQHLRVRVRRPIPKARYRTHDVGTKGHTQRIAMRNPTTGRWSTQSWIFPVKDVKGQRPKTMRMLKRLGVKREALRKVK
jgi:hypothetical protein